MTHIEQQRKLNARNKQRVQKLLGWDELQYGWFQHDCGIEYLRWSLQLDEYWIDALIRVPQFWQWWINAWNLREQRMFLPHAQSYVPTERLKLYKQIHTYRFIDSHPSKKVLDEAYSVMIGRCWDEVKTERINAEANH